MRIGLQPGVWTTALGLAGGGAIVIAPYQMLIGYGLLATAAGVFLWGVRINGRHWWQRRKALEQASPSDPHRAIREDIQRVQLEAERADALASLEFRRGLDAYVSGKPRAPPPLPEMGTAGAAVFGIDGPRTAAVIDIKNFGHGTALNVRYRAVCGIFPQKPRIPESFDKSGVLGRCEAGHTQNIQFIFEHPVTGAEVTTFRRDGMRALYAIAEISYEDQAGQSLVRLISYYLDPLAPMVDGRFMMSICDVGDAG